MTQTGYPTVLMTVTNTPAATGGINCLNTAQISSTTTTLDTGIQKKTALVYDSYGNVKSQTDYDWGQGGSTVPRRTLATTYLYENNSAYAGVTLNLVHLPVGQDSRDGSGNTLGRKVWHYDESSLTGVSASISGHDSGYGTGLILRGNLTTSWDWLSGTTYLGQGFTYDSAGDIVQHVMDNGAVTGYAFNEDGTGKYAGPTTITDPLQHATKLSYDYNAVKVNQVTDANMKVTTLAYADGFDRLTNVTNPVMGQTNIAYPAAYWTVVYHDKTTSFDRAYQDQSVTDGFGRVVETRHMTDSQHFVAVDRSYDALGRVHCETNPTTFYIPTWTPDGLGYLTCYNYDSLSRTTLVNLPDGGTVSTLYSGNSATTTDAQSKSRRVLTDALGRLRQVYEDPAGLNKVTQYNYDALGNLLMAVKCSTNDINSCGTSQSRVFTYDAMSRQTSANNPESGTLTYSYVNTGGAAVPTLQKRTDALGRVTNYSYDALERLSGVTYSDGTPSVNYTFDNVGNLTTAASGSAVTSYPSYDAAHRPLSSSVQMGGQTYSFGYSYDLSGNLLSETYPSGRVLTTSYDTGMRATSTSGTKGSTTTPYVQAVGYYPHGAVGWWKYGNSVFPVETFSQMLRPAQDYSTLNNDNSKWLLYTSYTWNSNGTVQGGSECYGAYVPSASETCLNQTYGYDALNRLTSASEAYTQNPAAGAGYSRGFSYDIFGNMSVAANANVPLSGLTPMTAQNPFNTANNRLIGASYFASGELQHIGTLWFAYDAESRQTQASDTSTGQLLIYTYDAAGNRVRKVDNNSGATTVYVHDAFGGLAAEYSSVAATPVCNTCYLSYDQVGSVRVVTNEAGAVVARHDYLPYGEEIPSGSAGRVGNSFGVSENVAQRFTGQERDGGTVTLDYFNARHFSAVTGAFTQVDPGNAGADLTNPQSWNAYGYVLGNPLGLVDPSGTFAEANPGPFCMQDWFCINETGGGGGGGTGGGAPQGTVTRVYPPPTSSKSNTPPPKTGTHTCAASFWVMKGNPNHIGRVGGFPGYTIARDSGVIAPDQFGFINGPAMAAAIGDQVSGSVTIQPNPYWVGARRHRLQITPNPLTFNFSNVRDTIGAGAGGLPPGALPGENVRQALERLHPGSVLLELPGLDLKAFAGPGSGSLTLSTQIGCPGGN